MKRAVTFLAIAATLIVALVACNLGGIAQKVSQELATPAPSELEGGEEAAPSAGEEEWTPEAEAAITPEAEAPPEATAEEGLSVSSLTEGLESLNSYKSTFTMRFVGKDEEGNPVDGSWESREEFTRQPAAQRLVVNSAGFGGQAGQTGEIEIITIGDTTYMVTVDEEGKRSCMSVSSEETTVSEGQLFSPSQMGGISGANYIGSETVNGVQTKHYSWSESGLGAFGFASAKGEAWVATDGNYVVKYKAEATGKGALFGSSEWEGTITLEYNLTEANGPFTIQPPADCQTPATDIPLMADAYDKASFGEMLTYKSNSALEEVVAFYQAQMPASGWQPSGETTQMEGFATLNFTKEGRKATVMITLDQEANVTSVVITTGQE